MPVVPFAISPVAHRTVIIPGADERAVPADAPALDARLFALCDESIALGAEHLDLAVLAVEDVLHLAERLLERLVTLRELHHLGVDVRPGCLALRQDVIECEGEVGFGGRASGHGRGARGRREVGRRGRVAFAAFGSGELQTEGTTLTGELDDGIRDGGDVFSVDADARAGRDGGTTAAKGIKLDGGGVGADLEAHRLRSGGGVRARGGRLTGGVHS